MVGQQVKLSHMGALICLVTLALFLQTGPWPFGVLERILVAAALQMTDGGGGGLLSLSQARSPLSQSVK